MKKNNNVPIWDLTYIFKSINDEKIFEDLNLYLKKSISFNKKYINKIAKISNTELLNAIKKYESIVENSLIPLWYLELNHSVNQGDQNLIIKIGKAELLFSKINKNIDFFENELSKFKKRKSSLIINSDLFKNYKNYLSQVFKNSKHVLDKELELLLIDTDINGRSAWKKFRNIYETKFEYLFKSPGDKKQRKYLQAELVYLASKHPSSKTRYNALETLMKKYKENAYVFSYIYNCIIQDMIQIDKNKRKYNPLIEKRNISNQLSQKQVNTMLESVKDHYYIAQKFWKLKAKLLKIKDFKSSDVYAGLKNVKEKTYSFTKTVNIVESALNDFDSDLAKLFKSSISNKLIHARLCSSKRSGAFCASISTSHDPVMMLNFTGRLSDISTLAHEAGHWLHDKLTIKKQTKLNCNPPLTTCETASVFNEMLLYKYLKEELKNEKLVLLNYMVSKMDSIIATVFRQSAFSFFEQEVFSLSEHGPLSEEDFSKVFEKNYKELYANAVKFTPNYKYQWAYVPHFMNSPFYVYAYSFGELATLLLFNKYQNVKDKKAFATKYKEFLSKGSFYSPCELYKSMGININKKETWDEGFSFIDQIYDDICNLV